MIDVRNIKPLYQLADIQIIHIAGQFLDAFLFIYLIQNFFEPKKRSSRQKRELAEIGSLFAAVLFLTDMVMKNNFYSYMAVMILFPFVYACICFRGKVIIKGLICLTFFTMMYSLENLMIYLGFYFSDHFLLSMEIWRVLFFFRRIVLKAVLLLALRILIIDVMRSKAKIMNGYWGFMAVVCVTDYMIFYYLLSSPADNKRELTQGLILCVFCIIVPMACYYMISLIIKIGEIHKVAIAQAMWMGMQKQHLEEMEDMQEAMKQFRHDYKEHLFCIDALVADQKYEELHRYLEKLHQMPMDKAEIIPYTADNSINLVLNQKKKHAQKLGIPFGIKADIDAEGKKRKGKVQIYDLNILLSNLCDNAIEAASKAKDGKVSLLLTRKKAYLKIEIKNSTNGNVLELNPQFETSKKEKELHGMGIKIIKNIVRTYDGIYETEAASDFLKISIMLMDE